MSLTEFTRRLVDKRLSDYCQRKALMHGGDKIEITFRIQWNKVTLSARREFGGSRNGSVLSMQPVAQMRYDDLQNRWTLYYADWNADWHRYPGSRPSADFDRLLGEVDSDPTGIFWK